MTEEEKNTPITLGMLGSILKEVEELMTPKINAFSDAVDRSCNSYEKSILEERHKCIEIMWLNSVTLSRKRKETKI